MKCKNIFFMLLIIIIFSNLALAINYNEVNSITLLSVSELKNGSTFGNTAKLYLTVKPGRGSVYIDSFPLAKIDTQLSTKLANGIACSSSKTNCNELDFFYTIDVESSLVGGPSAGAAIALLTYSVLEGNPLDESIAITGMISSGGIITPVDGIEEKVKAAALDENIKYIFVPSVALYEDFEITLAKNKTIDEEINESLNNVTNINQNKTYLTLNMLKNYSNDVYAVSNIKEVYSIVKNKKYVDKEEILIPDFYIKTMNETQEKLCNKTKELISIFDENNNQTLFINALKNFNSSVEALKENDFYSSASFCYSANLKLRELQLQNLSQDLLFENYLNLINSHDKFTKKMEDYPLKTFTDLEAYMIVTERLLESKKYFSSLNLSNISSNTLAYSIERYYSAVAWSSFLGKEGNPLEIDEENLKKACLEQIKKANMITSYLELFLPSNYLEDISYSIKNSEDFLSLSNYPMCLYSASKARADGEYILNTISVDDDIALKKLITIKLNRMQTLISEQEKAFPIMGYSYLEYSKNLINTEPISALIFSEYGLIFSDLTEYFPISKKFKVNFDFKICLIFIIVFSLGFILGILVSNSKKIFKKRSRGKPLLTFPGKKR